MLQIHCTCVQQLSVDKRHDHNNPNNLALLSYQPYTVHTHTHVAVEVCVEHITAAMQPHPHVQYVQYQYNWLFKLYPKHPTPCSQGNTPHPVHKVLHTWHGQHDIHHTHSYGTLPTIAGWHTVYNVQCTCTIQCTIHQSAIQMSAAPFSPFSLLQVHVSLTQTHFKQLLVHACARRGAHILHRAIHIL